MERTGNGSRKRPPSPLPPSLSGRRGRQRRGTTVITDGSRERPPSPLPPSLSGRRGRQRRGTTVTTDGSRGRTPSPLPPSLSGRRGRQRRRMTVTTDGSRERPSSPLPPSLSGRQGRQKRGKRVAITTEGPRVEETICPSRPASSPAFAIPPPVHGSLYSPIPRSQPSSFEFAISTSGPVMAGPSASQTPSTYASFFRGEHSSDARVREMEFEVRLLPRSTEISHISYFDSYFKSVFGIPSTNELNLDPTSSDDSSDSNYVRHDTPLENLDVLLDERIRDDEHHDITL